MGPTRAQDFLGRWQIERVIEDRLGPEGRFDGVAEICAGAANWTYHERGQLRLANGAGFGAERRYIWQPGPGGITVLFDDGRPFHHIALAGGADTHDCPPDQYAVRYDFAHWPLWMATWRVTGPRKYYVMRSRYRQQRLP